MKIFVVVPAYNEDKRIGGVLDDLIKTKLPVIVIDDGSKDKTNKVVSSYKKKILNIRHKVNLGKGAALKTGCQAAFDLGADAVIMIDSDGQHKVEDLGQFIVPLKKGYEIVFGTRNFQPGSPLIRYFGNKFATQLTALLFNIFVSDLICGYRALTKKAFRKLNWESSGYGVETEMVIRAGRLRLKHCDVPVQTVYFDKFKGVTIMDAFGILLNVIKWRIK